MLAVTDVLSTDDITPLLAKGRELQPLRDDEDGASEPPTSVQRTRDYRPPTPVARGSTRAMGNKRNFAPHTDVFFVVAGVCSGSYTWVALAPHPSGWGSHGP